MFLPEIKNIYDYIFHFIIKLRKETIEWETFDNDINYEEKLNENFFTDIGCTDKIDHLALFFEINS